MTAVTPIQTLEDIKSMILDCFPLIKEYDQTDNFLISIRKKTTKIYSSPNVVFLAQNIPEQNISYKIS